MNQARKREAGVIRRGGGRVLAFDVSRSDPSVRRVLELVSAATGVSAALLRHKSRCTADVAEARQLAMYLLHVVFQRTYEDIGRALGRERTTVSHACGVIEDRRDDPRFETMVADLEARLQAAPQQEADRAVG